MSWHCLFLSILEGRQAGHTWNVKGLGHPIKRKRVLTFLKKEKVNIAFLQETHLSDIEHQKLKRDWVGQVFFSSYTTQKRGTAILIH